MIPIHIVGHYTTSVLDDALHSLYLIKEMICEIEPNEESIKCTLAFAEKTLETLRQN